MITGRNYHQIFALLRSARSLDGRSSMHAALSGRAPWSHAPMHGLAPKSGEICTSLRFFRRRRNGVAGPVEDSQTPAILALAAAVGKTGRTVFPLLQSQPAGPLADMAYAGAFAVRAFPMFFCHVITFPFSSIKSVPTGNGDKSTCCGLPAAAGESSHGIGGKVRPPAGKHGGNPDARRAHRPSL